MSTVYTIIGNNHYICDRCGKVVFEFEDRFELVSYKSNWVKETENWHFCSEKCLRKWLKSRKKNERKAEKQAGSR